MPEGKKLGRKAVVTDTRTLRLSKFFTAQLPPPPVAVNYGQMPLPGNGPFTGWGEMLNDELGDCTCAAIGHACQTWELAATGTIPPITDGQVESIYESWCGYVPGDPSTDQGGVELNVLKAFKAQGFAGFTLTAFASVLPANQQHVMQAIYLFTGLYIGMDIPQYIMPDDGDVPMLWDVNSTADNTIIGGHAVYVIGYNSVGPKFVSWGEIYQMTWAFWSKFVDEAYSLISKQQFEKSGLAPSGFSLDALETDLVNIT
jgi:hypothetical protein